MKCKYSFKNISFRRYLWFENIHIGCVSFFCWNKHLNLKVFIEHVHNLDTESFTKIGKKIIHMFCNGIDKDLCKIYEFGISLMDVHEIVPRCNIQIFSTSSFTRLRNTSGSCPKDLATSRIRCGLCV